MTYGSANQYDFIFLGAGCASLSILMRMIDSGKFSDKKILLVDKEVKNKNDRTWCFWEKGNGYFENLVYQKWDLLFFKTEKLSIPLDISPYQYKMIRGTDFYKNCFSKINLQPNIDSINGEISIDIDKIKIDGNHLDDAKAIVFNSIYLPAEKDKNKFYLLQHFKGLVIETASNLFNNCGGTLMDFSISQKHGTSFVYVLPLSKNKALIEYTLFTENLLEKEEYDLQLQNYIRDHLRLNDFKIVEEEFGIIPMTNVKFNTFENRMYNIGTAGGQTKASTGYTFKFIQKQAEQIVQALILTGFPLKKINTKNRFQFYDSTLLHILAKKKLEGKEIFTELFKKNKASSVFKFLDNETNLREEIKIISSLPTRQFLVAGIKEFFKMI